MKRVEREKEMTVEYIQVFIEDLEEMFQILTEMGPKLIIEIDDWELEHPNDVGIPG